MATMPLLCNLIILFINPMKFSFLIAEIWEYAGSLERENFKPDTFDAGSLENIIRKLQADMAHLKRKMS